MSTFDISIPILVDKMQPAGEPAYYRTRPVFFTGYERVDPREDRAVRHLREDLRKGFGEMAREMQHDLLAAWGFHPRLQHRRLELTLTLRKRTLRTQLFIVLFESLGRNLAASPQVSEVCFEILSGESLEQRAMEVYTEHFRKLEKNGVDLSAYQFDDLVYSHLDTLTLDIDTAQKMAKEDETRPFAFLGGEQEMSGSHELERTGRCLNRLYPNELQRAIARDETVEQLKDWLKIGNAHEQKPAPLVILGPNQVGKTAVLHEWLFLELEKAPDKRTEVWLLSPQRLISGMSYLGQWEERLLSILEYAASPETGKQIVLYFDDLLGLFQAGKSRDSNLTIGQVLKMHLEEGRLRVIAEATPSAWRKLREVDRSFADLFNVVHLREPAERETLRILIRTVQELEQLHACRFSPEVLPLIVELPRRFVRGRAFPGKGAELLRQLAVTHPGGEIGKAEVYRFFENKTGINQRFMDRHEMLSTKSVEAFFRERIVGQHEAVHAMIDAIVLAKAQLNDPERPVASLLFLGPTGVGKTECAKALAEFYFGTRERLLRFDMNEFNGWDAVPRLIGAFGGRQGALTGAVKRKPHAVILLDEIEKANPQVFDLLLQVLDDGRLTDANGVTTDFCNTIIVLTSNLGARDARARVGFGAIETEDVEVYRDAARKFFRPEFFNRLDKVVAFHELGREHIEGIVRNLVHHSLHRQGLHQRQLSLSLDPEVFDFLADAGFNKEFGARALRRAVEDYLMEPLAIQLSGTIGRRPAFLRGSVREKRIVLDMRELTAVATTAPVPPRLTAQQALKVSRSAIRFVRRVDDEMESWRESDEEHLSQLDRHYYQVREELIQLRQNRDKLQGDAENAAQQPVRRHAAQPSRFGRHPKMLYVPRRDANELLAEIFQSADSGALLEKLAERSSVLDTISHQTNQLVQHAARVEYLANPRFSEPDRLLVKFHVNHAGLLEGDVEERYEAYRHWVESYVHFFQNPPALTKKTVLYHPGEDEVETDGLYSVSSFLSNELYFLYGEGPGFRKLLEKQLGLELFCFASHSFGFGGIEVFAMRQGESLRHACRRISQSPTQLMEATGQVVRIRHEKGWVLDLKSGILTQNPKVQLWSFLTPLLTRPAEFEGA